MARDETYPLQTGRRTTNSTKFFFALPSNTGLATKGIVMQVMAIGFTHLLRWGSNARQNLGSLSLKGGTNEKRLSSNQLVVAAYPVFKHIEFAVNAQGAVSNAQFSGISAVNPNPTTLARIKFSDFPENVTLTVQLTGGSNNLIPQGKPFLFTRKGDAVLIEQEN